MNKLLLAVFAVSMFTVPACAQSALQLPDNWQEALKQKTDSATFEYAMKTLKKPLLLTIPVTKQFFDKDSMEAEIPSQETVQYRKLQNVQTYPSTTGCKAYVLDEHWVMAGGTCLWNGRHTIAFTDKSGTFATGLVEPNPAQKDLKINATAIAWKQNLFVQPHDYDYPHIILVRVPQAASAALHLERYPKINVWAFAQQQPLDLKGGDFYIHSSRYNLNAVCKRTLEAGSVSTLITLQEDWADLSGVSTDPLVYIKQGNLHWLGVNTGVTKLHYNDLLGDWDGKPSSDYFAFTAKDVQFIKETISKHDPAAWKRIEKRKGLEIL